MFGRKASAEEVLKLFAQLSDEEKAKVLKGVQPKPEDERPAPESEKSGEENEVQGENEQTENIPAEGEEEAQESSDGITAKEGEGGAEQTEESVETDGGEEDPLTEENGEEVTAKLAERVSALEEALKGFEDLKARMEEFTAKQAENFGYKGRPFGERKSMEDMSADELKESILSGK